MALESVAARPLVLADHPSGNTLAAAVWRLEQRLEGERRSTQRQVQRLERRLEDSVQFPPSDGRWAELEGYIDGLAETVHALVRRAEDTNSMHYNRAGAPVEDVSVTTFCEAPRVEMAQVVSTAVERLQRLQNAEQTLHKYGNRIDALEDQSQLHPEANMLTALVGRMDFLEGQQSQAQSRLQVLAGLTGHINDACLNSPRTRPSHTTPILLDAAPVLLDSPAPGRGHAQPPIKQIPVGVRSGTAIQDLTLQVDRVSESIAGMNARILEAERGQTCLAELDKWTTELGSRVQTLERADADRSQHSSHLINKENDVRTSQTESPNAGAKLSAELGMLRRLDSTHEDVAGLKKQLQEVRSQLDDFISVKEIAPIGSNASEKLSAELGMMSTVESTHEEVAGLRAQLQEVVCQVADIADVREMHALICQQLQEVKCQVGDLSDSREMQAQLCQDLRDVKSQAGELINVREMHADITRIFNKAVAFEIEAGIVHNEDVHCDEDTLRYRTEDFVAWQTQLWDQQRDPAESVTLQDLRHVFQKVSGLTAESASTGDDQSKDFDRGGTDSEAFSFRGQANSPDLEMRLEHVEQQVISLQDAAEMQDLRQQVSGVGEQVLRLLVRLQDVEHGLGDAYECRALRDELGQVAEESQASRAHLADAECGLKHLADAFSRVCGEVAELRARIDDQDDEARARQDMEAEITSCLADVERLTASADDARQDTEAFEERFQKLEGGSKAMNCPELREVIAALQTQLSCVERKVVQAKSFEFDPLQEQQSRLEDRLHVAEKCLRDQDNSELREFKEDLAALRRENAALQSRIGEFEAGQQPQENIELKQLQSELSSFQGEHARLQDMMNEACEHRQRIVQKLESQQNQDLLEAVSKDLATLHREHDTLQNRICVSATAQSDQSTEIKDLQHQLSTIQGEHARLHDIVNTEKDREHVEHKLEDQHNPKLEVLMEELATVCREHATLQIERKTEIKQVHDQLSSMQSQHARLQDIVNEGKDRDHAESKLGGGHNPKLEALMEELATVCCEHATLQTERKSEVKQVHDQLSSMQSQHARLQDMVNEGKDHSARKSEADHNPKLEALMEEMAMVCREHAALQMERTTEINQLHDQLSSVHSRHDTLQHAIIEARECQENVAHNSHLQSDAELQALKEELTAARCDHATLQEKISDLVKDTQVALTDEIRHLQDQLSSIHEEFARLQDVVNNGCDRKVEAEHKSEPGQVQDHATIVHDERFDLIRDDQGLGQHCEWVDHSTHIQELQDQMSSLKREHVDFKGQLLDALEEQSFQICTVQQKGATAEGEQNGAINQLQEEVAAVQDLILQQQSHLILESEMRSQAVPATRSANLHVDLAEQLDVESKAQPHGIFRQNMEGALPTALPAQHSDILARLSQLELCLQDMTEVHDLGTQFAGFCESVANFQAEVRTAVQQPSCTGRVLEPTAAQTSEEGVTKLSVAEEEQQIWEPDDSELVNEPLDLEQLRRAVKHITVSVAQRAHLDEYRAEALDAVDSRVSAVTERLTDTCERLLDMERSLEASRRNSSMLRTRFDRMEGGIEKRVDVLAEDLAEMATRQLEIEKGFLASGAQGSGSVSDVGVISRLEMEARLARLPTGSSLFRSRALPPPPMALPSSESRVVNSLVCAGPEETSAGTSTARLPQTR